MDEQVTQYPLLNSCLFQTIVRWTAKGKWRKGGKEEKENTSIKGRKGTERKGKGGKDMTDVFECVGMSWKKERLKERKKKEKKEKK